MIYAVWYINLRPATGTRETPSSVSDCAILKLHRPWPHFTLYIQHLPQHSSDSAVTVEIGSIPMRDTASTGGSKPRLYCHNLHNTLCICVGAPFMPARYEYNSTIVSIVFVLDTISQPCILGLVCRLRSDATPGNYGCPTTDEHHSNILRNSIGFNSYMWMVLHTEYYLVFGMSL
jgi:hypothetical protein